MDITAIGFLYQVNNTHSFLETPPHIPTPLSPALAEKVLKPKGPLQTALSIRMSGLWTPYTVCSLIPAAPLNYTSHMELPLNKWLLNKLLHTDHHFPCVWSVYPIFYTEVYVTTAIYDYMTTTIDPCCWENIFSVSVCAVTIINSEVDN